MVFVVRGCVPAGEALGSGVTVFVGCGVSWRGVTVAVGRGPAGMVGVGMGVAVSLGEFARTAVAPASAASSSVNMRERLIITASGPLPSPDVDP